jgi:rare lipoprotein A
LARPDPIPVAERRSLLGNPHSYTALGQQYTVLAESHGFVERGVASWYGPDFHGERTSVGEPYDMYAMTAAHRTLPLPAYARITNLRNGHSVVVRLNDRGPFKANRIVDMSYAAALKLDMLREGTTWVELRVLEPAQDAPPPPAPAPVYAQAGAFAVQENAARMERKLVAAGISSVFVRHDAVKDRSLYRVRIGPVASVTDYDTLVQRLNRLGITQVTLAPN